MPATKTAIYVNSGGVKISNTINRAELTGIASALRAKCTDTATDSVRHFQTECLFSISDMERTLISLITPEAHTYQTLGTIVSMIKE